MSINLVEKAPRYLSPTEAAELFGVKRGTIYRVRRGTLPAVRLGGSIRIPADALAATLEGTRTGPSGKAAAANRQPWLRDAMGETSKAKTRYEGALDEFTAARDHPAAMPE